MTKKNSQIYKAIAAQEGVSVDTLSAGVADGSIVITRSNRRQTAPLGIGRGLRVKVNANIGTSQDRPSLPTELQKLKVAVEAGADTVMDLSTGGELDEIRQAILGNSRVPLGTVPIYQAIVELARVGKSLVKMTSDHLFRVIEKQARDGVDFVTVHCGVTLEAVKRLRREQRITDVVSRGGAFMVEWMYANRRENPLYAEYGILLEIARKYDLTLSLGDGLRPGSLADATDRAQVQELVILGELVDRAREAGVQVMVEGPGHVPLNQIEANIVLEKEICKGAPFYVLGPLVTDVAPGYDHITAAIGGALAAFNGADFLCYVTPSEHLRLPTVDDVREGVIALRIAAHAADIARGRKEAFAWDLAMSRARKSLDWERMIALALDPQRARDLHQSDPAQSADVCTMCGDFCAMKKIRDVFLKEKRWEWEEKKGKRGTRKGVN